eukprot:169895-Chlamydomonas_euryale.AAC.3
MADPCHIPSAALQCAGRGEIAPVLQACHTCSRIYRDTHAHSNTCIVGTCSIFFGMLKEFSTSDQCPSVSHSEVGILCASNPDDEWPKSPCQQ